jgi:hypothetical protein
LSMVVAKSTLENRLKATPVLHLLVFCKTGHSNRVCIEHTLLLQTQTLFEGFGSVWVRPGASSILVHHGFSFSTLNPSCKRGLGSYMLSGKDNRFPESIGFPEKDNR